MSTEPEYARLQLQAAAWLEKFDPATGSKTLVATVPPGGDEALAQDCTLLVLPILGTDPVQYLYSCQSENCLGACTLRWRQTVFGPVYWCECQAGSKKSARLVSKAAKAKPAGGTRPRSKSKRAQSIGRRSPKLS